MAKKSKTQRAKASAARAARKEQVRAAEVAEMTQVAEVAASETEASKKKLFKRAEKTVAPASDGKQAKDIKPAKDQSKRPEKKEEKKPAKKRRFAFLKDVRLEMKRVTWPVKQDVFRWSIVVVFALLFFGIFVAVLDNVIITPLLVAISSFSVGA